MVSPTSWTKWPGVAPGTLDVFSFELRPASAADWELLDEGERARAERLIVEQKRDQFVVSRATLRRVLAVAGGGAAQELRFDYGEHDKPRLRDRESPSFNLSHSHRFAALALAADALALGIDIEHARDGRDFEAIARSFFSERERAQLASLPGDARRRAFYRAWTRKEAYLKAIGTGLSFASSRFSIEFREHEEPRVLASEWAGDDPASWRMIDLPLAPDYAAAACWASAALDLRLWHIAGANDRLVPR